MLEQDLEFIYQSLMPRTKIQISYLGDLLGCKLKSNLRKSEMATGLADYIINRSDEWLRCLPQRELDLLEIMVKMEKGSEFRTFLQPYGTVMEAFGFITEERDDDSSTFTIAAELYDSRAYSVDEISKTTGISRATLYKYINLRKDKTQK